ncbi:MAG: tRNA (cytidine(34)-2'-O)-methyltransferase [Clostridia bacterium]|nr:tRNA (cytidine(34)-2'-O)-methyltransferase [Clostridia bacterium]
MHQLNIVLVEPEIAGNTGNISRTCAATGARLHLIKPLGFELDDKRMKRAGLDYWHLLDITVYENLEEFYAKNTGPYYYFTTKAPHVYAEVEYPEIAYLVFGKETKGLPEDLITQNLNTAVRLPMLDDDTARSLNLSNAVAVAAYEVLRQWDWPSLRLGGKFK